MKRKIDDLNRQTKQKEKLMMRLEIENRRSSLYLDGFRKRYHKLQKFFSQEGLRKSETKFTGRRSPPKNATIQVSKKHIKLKNPNKHKKLSFKQ